MRAARMVAVVRQAVVVLLASVKCMAVRKETAAMPADMRKRNVVVASAFAG